MGDPWKDISPGNGKRVNAKGKYDFFWIKFRDNSVGMVLELDGEPDVKKPLPKLRSIEITYRSEGKAALCIQLLENNQREVFEALCNDIVEAAEEADTISGALPRAISRTRRWHYLLKSGKANALSESEQRGLVGELAFLRALVSKIGAFASIEAWKGPYGAAKDFEFPNVCIEVKARRGAAKPHIGISSADQLTDIDGARLFLQVYDTSTAVKPNGMNLHDHVQMTAEFFDNDSAILECWQNAIDATGYDKNHDYEERNWIIGVERTYEVFEMFPRITTPLPEGLGNVKYTIDLDSCEKYKCPTDDAFKSLKEPKNG